MVQHSNLINPLVNMIMTAEPNRIVDRLFEIAEPYFGRTIDVWFEMLFGFCLARLSFHVGVLFG